MQPHCLHKPLRFGVGRTSNFVKREGRKNAMVLETNFIHSKWVLVMVFDKTRSQLGE